MGNEGYLLRLNNYSDTKLKNISESPKSAP